MIKRCATVLLEVRDCITKVSSQTRSVNKLSEIEHQGPQSHGDHRILLSPLHWHKSLIIRPDSIENSLAVTVTVSFNECKEKELHDQMTLFQVHPQLSQI
jgi:hypothetical protein